MNILQATKQYEQWLAKHITVVKTDLAHKHELMATSSFAFLRGTFYRWAMLFPQALPELLKAPVVLGVGDLHVENFGTWRDAEGRLVWGINDFDEACPLPFTNDLVRLATSAAFALERGDITIPLKQACQIIVEFYRECLERQGKAFVLAEKNRTLGAMARQRLKDPRQFFKRLDREAKNTGKVPHDALALLMATLPVAASKPTFFQRQAGVGSLGRQRFLALSELADSRIAREAKAILPSAWAFANSMDGSKEESTIYIKELEQVAVRSHDPFLTVQNGWVVRRLAPDCARIELVELPGHKDERELLAAMGAEVANVHLGTPKSRLAILRFIDKQKPNWLFAAAKVMAAATDQDFRDWRASR